MKVLQIKEKTIDSSPEEANVLNLLDHPMIIKNIDHFVTNLSDGQS